MKLVFGTILSVAMGMVMVVAASGEPAQLPVPAVKKVVLAPKAVCYKKVITCCFRFAACGVQVVSKKVAAKCPKRTCAKRCFSVCKPKSVAGTRRKCYNTLAFKKRCYKHPWLPKICITYPVRAKKCATFDVKSVSMPCRKVCRKVCSVAIKPCVYFRVFHYPKFCPALKCGKVKVVGSAVKPKVFVSSAGKFIKKSHTPLGLRK